MFILKLNVIMLNFVMLNVIMLSGVGPPVSLSVNKLTVILLSVEAPQSNFIVSWVS